MVKHPGFFKFYIPEFSAESLKIPPMFVRSIQGSLPENVALRDQYNNLWQVKVVEIGNNWYFMDGWPQFVNDNSIKGGDLLVYKYLSQGLFDFKIFGPSACEEKGVGGNLYEKAEENAYMVESNTANAALVRDVDDDYVLTTRQEYKRDDPPRKWQVMDVGSSTNANRSKREYDWYGAEIFRSGQITQPSNPYFVTTTKRSRPFELYIPMDFVKGYDLDLPETILLVDPTGRKFHAKRKIWKDGRVVFKGGWKSLCAVNMVGKDEHCICEFIQPQGEDVYLSVSFVRAK